MKTDKEILTMIDKFEHPLTKCDGTILELSKKYRDTTTFDVSWVIGFLDGLRWVMDLEE